MDRGLGKHIHISKWCPWMTDMWNSIQPVSGNGTKEWFQVKDKKIYRENIIKDSHEVTTIWYFFLFLSSKWYPKVLAPSTNLMTCGVNLVNCKTGSKINNCNLNQYLYSKPIVFYINVILNRMSLLLFLARLRDIWRKKAVLAEKIM